MGGKTSTPSVEVFRTFNFSYACVALNPKQALRIRRSYREKTLHFRRCSCGGFHLSTRCITLFSGELVVRQTEEISEYEAYHGTLYHSRNDTNHIQREKQVPLLHHLHRPSVYSQVTQYAKGKHSKRGYGCCRICQRKYV